MQPTVEDRQVSARSTEIGADPGGHIGGEGATGWFSSVYSSLLFYVHVCLAACLLTHVSFTGTVLISSRFRVCEMELSDIIIAYQYSLLLSH